MAAISRFLVNLSRNKRLPAAILVAFLFEIIFFAFLLTVFVFDLTSNSLSERSYLKFVVSLILIAILLLITLLSLIGLIVIRKLYKLEEQHRILLSKSIVRPRRKSLKLGQSSTRAFEYFQSGEYSKTLESIQETLSTRSKLGLYEFDLLVWLTWHTVENSEQVVTDALQVCFENQFARRSRSKLRLLDGSNNQLSIGAQAQWHRARILSGGTVFNWQPSEDVVAVANKATSKDFSLSSDFLESVAAIRFGLPEDWLSGNETRSRQDLQKELKSWVNWVCASKDADLLNHLRIQMESTNGDEKEILISEGSAENSQFFTLKHGLNLPPTEGLERYEPTKNMVLYFLHNSLPWDSAGYATRSHALIKALNSKGWDTHGVTRVGYPFDIHNYLPEETVGNDEVDGVTYHRIGRKDEKLSGTFSYLNHYSNRSVSVINLTKPEIIHAASNSWNGLVATHLAAQLGVPSVYEVRGLWEVTRRSATPGYEFTSEYRLQVKLETQAALQASHVFALTGALRDELVRRGVPESKITLLPNAVDETRFTPIPRNVELEKKFGYEGKQVIGYVGSLLKYEGLDLLLKAAADLSNIRDDFRVLIVGSGVEHEHLMELAKELGLEEIVNFTGKVPHSEVEQYYSLIDIAPFPRLPLPVCEMVSPLKPFEAMAMEKACIVSNCAALTEIVQDGVTGRVFEKGSHESLAEALTDLLNNPDQTHQYAKAGRSWVLENRTWSKNAEIVQGVYKKLLGE